MNEWCLKTIYSDSNFIQCLNPNAIFHQIVISLVFEHLRDKGITIAEMIFYPYIAFMFFLMNRKILSCFYQIYFLFSHYTQGVKSIVKERFQWGGRCLDNKIYLFMPIIYLLHKHLRSVI